MLSLPSCSYDIRTEFSKNGVGEGCSIDCCSVVMHPTKIGNNSNKRNEARILFKVTFILSHLIACVMPLQRYRVAPLQSALARVMRAGGIGQHPGALPGRDNAALPEPTPSHAN